jgi:hypothetical protein
VLVIVPSFLLPVVGVGLAIVYLAAIRPRIASTRDGIGPMPIAGQVGPNSAGHGSEGGTTPAGWYPDPHDPSTTRWWNGSTWADSGRGSDGTLSPPAQ